MLLAMTDIANYFLSVATDLREVSTDDTCTLSSPVSSMQSVGNAIVEKIEQLNIMGIRSFAYP